MKTIKFEKDESKEVARTYNWDLATDRNDKKLFAASTEFNAMTMQTIFYQFDFIEINSDDLVYGVYQSGQKTFIAKAPSIYAMAQEVTC